MSKYGHFFNGPGSPSFPGWPSKQPGKLSGSGRYNAPNLSGGFVPAAALPGAAAQLPASNVYTSQGWLIPAGPLSVAGSVHAQAAVFHNDQLYTLTVTMTDGRSRDYCCVPFQLIYLLRHATNPGEVFDTQIFPVFPCVLN